MTEETPYDGPFCLHLKVDWKCLQCGGTGYCKHGKYSCQECGWVCPQEEAPRAPDVPLCPHGKLDWNCLQCGGTGHCKHAKANCDECGWSGSKCPHERERRMCKECKANGIPVTGICEHNIGKFYCKRCPGRGICEHGMRRLSCATCRTIPLQPLTTFDRPTVTRRS